MLINELESYYRSIITQENLSAHYVRNLLKEQLHFYLLDFIYKHEIFRQSIFYGGTCLRHCFGLPRLSEDLDFEYLDKDFSFELLATDLVQHFRSAHHYDELVTKIQKCRLYLKFPLLKQLGIAMKGESDFLHVKIEVNITSHKPNSFSTEIQPLSVMQRTFFVKRYDLPTLMASKINAVINRSWRKQGKTVGASIDVKGRDYFDLIWYMQKGVKPRLEFTQFNSEAALWKAIKDRVSLLKVGSIQNDLQDFLETRSDALDFTRNIQPAFAALLQKYE